MNLGVLKEDKVNILVHGHEPTLSDVLVAAFDGVDTTYAVTQTAIVRLSPDPASLPYAFSYDDTPFEMRATADGVYVLGYASLRAFSPELAPIATLDLREQAPRSVTLGLLALAAVFIIVLVILGPRAWTEPYSKFILIGGSILFLALGILCTRMGRDGIKIGVMIIILAVCLFILGILV